MIDLFTRTMQIARHIATDSDVIILTTSWYKGEIHYDCKVPAVRDSGRKKGEIYFADATYSEVELELNN